MPIKIDIYDLYSQKDIPEDMISPIQTHSANIVEINIGHPMSDTDVYRLKAI